MMMMMIFIVQGQWISDSEYQFSGCGGGKIWKYGIADVKRYKNTNGKIYMWKYEFNGMMQIFGQRKNFLSYANNFLKHMQTVITFEKLLQAPREEFTVSNEGPKPKEVQSIFLVFFCCYIHVCFYLKVFNPRQLAARCFCQFIFLFNKIDQCARYFYTTIHLKALVVIFILALWAYSIYRWS